MSFPDHFRMEEVQKFMHNAFMKKVMQKLFSGCHLFPQASLAHVQSVLPLHSSHLSFVSVIISSPFFSALSSVASLWCGQVVTTLSTSLTPTL